jgi:hypothetical protein
MFLGRFAVFLPFDAATLEMVYLLGHLAALLQQACSHPEGILSFWKPP